MDFNTLFISYSLIVMTFPTGLSQAILIKILHLTTKGVLNQDDISIFLESSLFPFGYLYDMSTSEKYNGDLFAALVNINPLVQYTWYFILSLIMFAVSVFAVRYLFIRISPLEILINSIILVVFMLFTYKRCAKPLITVMKLKCTYTSTNEVRKR